MTPAHEPPTDDAITNTADVFAGRDFSDAELATIKKTRRRTPTIGDAATEVMTFRAPPAYKDRIRRRAAADHTTESQVIRDALDAYLSAAE